MVRESTGTHTICLWFFIFVQQNHRIQRHQLWLMPNNCQIKLRMTFKWIRWMALDLVMHTFTMQTQTGLRPEHASLAVMPGRYSIQNEVNSNAQSSHTQHTHDPWHFLCHINTRHYYSRAMHAHSKMTQIEIDFFCLSGGNGYHSTCIRVQRVCVSVLCAGMIAANRFSYIIRVSFSKWNDEWHHQIAILLPTKWGAISLLFFRMDPCVTAPHHQFGLFHSMNFVLDQSAIFGSSFTLIERCSRMRCHAKRIKRTLLRRPPTHLVPRKKTIHLRIPPQNRFGLSTIR